MTRATFQVLTADFFTAGYAMTPFKTGEFKSLMVRYAKMFAALAVVAAVTAVTKM